MKSFTASANDAEMRLSRFVLRVTHHLPNSVLYKSFRTGRIKVNGKKAAPDARLQQGDLVQLYLNDEFFAADMPGSHPKKDAPCPANLVSGSAAMGDPTPSFEILFENEHMAVLFKPVGLLSHSDVSGAPSLLGQYTSALIQRGDFSPTAENGFAPALCNRLDRGTEGLVLVAKTYPALRDANALLRQGYIQKTYLGITVGTPPQGVHHALLARDKAAKTVQVTAWAPVTLESAPANTLEEAQASAVKGSPPYSAHSGVPNGQPEHNGKKPITTGVSVLETHGGLSLCEINLITGRTHQIRAHLAFLGAPLLGDVKYGNPAANRRFGQVGQLLCAHSLAFAESLPDGNTLAAFAGRRFTAPQDTVSTWWKTHAHPPAP